MSQVKHTKSVYGLSGARSWIPAMLIIALSQTAQAELPLNQRYLMYDRNGPTYQYQSDPTAPYTGTVTHHTNATTAPAFAQSQMIVAPGGNIIIVPNTTTGRTQAIIGTGRYK